MFLTTTCRHSLRSLRPLTGHAQSRSFLQTPQRWLPRISRLISQSGTTPIPTGRASPPPPLSMKQIPSFGERLQRPRIGRQILFFFCGSTIIFALTTDWTARDNARWAQEAKRILPFWPFREYTVEDLRKIKLRLLGQELQKRVIEFKDMVSSMPHTIRNILLSTYAFAAQVYLDSSEGRRLCWRIVELNMLVYLMWKIPRLSGFMSRAFTHDPLSGRSYTLLTSIFSHKSFFHLVFNSMALTSFGGVVASYLPTTSTGGDVSGNGQLLLFLISAGLFSGLVSHVASAKILYPRMLSQISKLAAVRSSSAASALVGNVAQKPIRDILPSLGASGAIYGAMTLTAMAYPDAAVGMVLIPMAIPITLGVSGLVLIDVIGVIRGWQFLDHYAHLGGAAYGVLYYAYGKDLWHSYLSYAEEELKQLQLEEQIRKKDESRKIS